jgi:hypothetical protein
MSDLQHGLQAIVSHPPNAPVILRFKRFFYALLVAPVAVYAAVFTALNCCVEAGILDLSSKFKLTTPSLIAGIASVATVNLLTGVFALGAIYEPPIPQQLAFSSSSEEDDETEGESGDVVDNAGAKSIAVIAAVPGFSTFDAGVKRRPRRRATAD